MYKNVVIVVGAGPAGLFATYQLSKNKNLKIKVIEKGKDIYKRFCPVRDKKDCVHCEPCNIMCGFGGAGTYSDCKLSLTPYGVGGNVVDYIGEAKAYSYIDEVDKIFANFDKNSEKREIIGKKNKKFDEIAKKLEEQNFQLTNCPTKHLGTDGTYDVMVSLYEYLKLCKNVEFYFNEEAMSLFTNESNETKTIVCRSGLVITADYIIFAPGRSGNSWLSNIMKNNNVDVTSNGFDIGYRVEVPANAVKELTDNLYDMKISYTFSDGVKVRTFCTNPNGFVSEEHYNIDGKNIVLANGHSYANKKSDNTNFAVLVTIPEDSSVGRKFILDYNDKNNYKIAMGRLVGEHPFENEKTTTPTLKTDCSNIFAETNINVKNKIYSIDYYVMTFLQKLNTVYPGVFDSTTNYYGLEAKFYSDRIKLNENFETTIKNIYCAGDGSGVTRGIVQSAVMGLKIADDILRR